MAFDLQKLSLVTQQGAGLKNIWTYESADDAIADINTSGYFDDASDRLAVGDKIFVSDSAGVETIVYVASNASGVVDVTDGTTLAATDTD